MRLAKQSQFNPYPKNLYGELLIMPANGRRDLIRRLKVILSALLCSPLHSDLLNIAVCILNKQLPLCNRRYKYIGLYAALEM